MAFAIPGDFKNEEMMERSRINRLATVGRVEAGSGTK